MDALQAYTDDTLLELLKGGHEGAFAEIYSRYWAKLFTVAHNRLKSRMEAEEVVQDVFYSIWKRKETLNIQHTLNTYLSVAVKYQILNRQASTYYRMQSGQSEVKGTELAADTTQLWFDARELQQQLDNCIHQLPEKCRIVFLKSRQENKTNAQIAHELRISEKTVEAHITRALHILRNSLTVSLPLILLLLEKK